jgi:P4 family phage/plasmid primase-like protien
MSESPNLPGLARAYHGLGFNVLPTARDKKATVLWKPWQTERQSADDLTALPFDEATGVAAISGAVSAPGGCCLVAIDADRAPGDGVRLDLLGRLGLPRDYQWVVRTPGKGGGWHVWIIVEGLADELARRGLSAGRLESPFPGTDHIELRWTAVYTLLPPSAHPEGAYHWHNGNGAVPSEGPLSVEAGRVVRLGKWAGETKDGTRALAEPLPDEIISGSGQHPAMASIAGSMRRRDASAEAILAALRVENMRICKPPLPDADLEHIAKSMMRYAPATPIAGVANGTPRDEPRASTDDAPIPSGTPVENKLAVPFNLTELGNAERLAARHTGSVYAVRIADELRGYDPARGIYSSEHGLLVRYAADVVRSIYRDAGDDMSKAADTLRKHAKDSESKRALDAMLSLAQSLEALEAEVADFDADPELLNTRSGVVDLRSGALHPHSPKHRMTNIAGCGYDPDVATPMWDAFLERIFDGDEQVIAFLQRLFGYALTGYIGEQIFAIFHGVGANGKSVLVDSWHAAMGAYAETAAMKTFLPHRTEAVRTDLATFCGKRLVSTSESKAGQVVDAATIKVVTSRHVTCRFNYQRGEFTYTPQYLVILDTNFKPLVQCDDYAVKRRVLLVPFGVLIPDGEQDDKLTDKLIATELPGILAWGVAGAADYLAHGLQIPERVRAATAEYRTEMDALHEFWSGWLTFGNDATYTTAEALRNALDAWAKENGVDARDLPKGSEWGRQLRERGARSDKRWVGDRTVSVWCGVQIVGADDQKALI